MSATLRNRLLLALGLALALSVHGFAVAKEGQKPVIEKVLSGSRMHYRPVSAHIGGRISLADDYIAVDSPYPESYRNQWPGTYFEAQFKGSDVFFKFDDSYNIYRVLVDDEEITKLIKPGFAEYHISGLSRRKHHIRLERVTESQSSAGAFLGIALPPGNKPKKSPAPLARQIEFIGDSYTVGYGNTSPKRECTTDEVWATTDTSQAFGPLTAKAFNADYQINAYSGRGIVRNYNGFAGDTLPQLYDYTLFDGKTPYVRPESWRPQIIVIGLGTNDFSTPINPGEKWKSRDELHTDYETTYVAFVKRLRAQNPNAYFILMAADNVNGETLAEVTKVEAALKASGETRLSLIAMKGLGFTGCHAHPDVADDKNVAALLGDFINSKPDLWQGK